MTMEFTAIDVETANPDFSSICQIGVAEYAAGVLVGEWETYIDPEDYFDEVNIGIHGITEEMVKGSPTIAQCKDQVHRLLNGRVCVCHTHFDRTAIRQASEKCCITLPNCTWLDSASVARRTWREFAHRGYGLSNLSEFLGYEYKAHDALEDAKAAANVVLRAAEVTGLDIEGWLRRVCQPIDMGDKSIRRAGNQDGHLYGEVVVFTGRLSLPRCEAADLAAKVGCRVDSGVTRETTVLVVGDQDIRQLAGHEKSSKHRKAEALIGSGQSIRIVRESDFAQLVATF
jgi:DNA polymerase III subunit epsilon